MDLKSRIYLKAVQTAARAAEHRASANKRSQTDSDAFGDSVYQRNSP